MENTFAFKLLNTRFQEHRQLTKATVAGNFILVVCYLIANPTFLWQNMHVQLSLLSGILILLLILFYDWKKPLANFAIILLYLGIFIIEFIFVGIPENPMPSSNYFGKGLMLELLMMLVPGIYMGIRLSMIFPLVQVYWSSVKLKKRIKASSL